MHLRFRIAHHSVELVLDHRRRKVERVGSDEGIENEFLLFFFLLVLCALLEALANIGFEGRQVIMTQVLREFVIDCGYLTCLEFLEVGLKGNLLAGEMLSLDSLQGRSSESCVRQEP